MKYKVGDKVKIKSLEWYNSKKDSCGDILLTEMCNSKHDFVDFMSEFCGKIVTINHVCENRGYYDIKEDDAKWYWTDEMIEGLAETEMVSLDKARAWVKNIFIGMCSDSLAESIAQDFYDAMKN